jgi:histidine ammonia-lyase
MATFAARRLAAMADNTGHILAIELLAAAQGIESHRPMRSTAALEHIHAHVRSLSPALAQDRSLAADIEATAQWLRSPGLLLTALRQAPSALERAIDRLACTSKAG